MKKYIIIAILLLLLPFIVFAETSLENYEIKMDINNEYLNIKESFIVTSIDDRPYYEKKMSYAATNIDTNLDDYQIEIPSEEKRSYEDSVISFKLEEGKTYYLSYDINLSKDGFSYYPISDIYYKDVSVLLMAPTEEERKQFDIDYKDGAIDYMEEGNTAYWYYKDTNDLPSFTVERRKITNSNEKSALSKEESSLLFNFSIVVPAFILFYIIFNSVFFRDDIFAPASLILIGLTIINYLLLNFLYLFLKDHSSYSYALVLCGVVYLMVLLAIFYTNIKVSESITSRVSNEEIIKNIIKVVYIIIYGILLRVSLLEANEMAISEYPMYYYILAIIILFLNFELSSRYYWHFKKDNIEPNSKYKPINSYHFPYKKKKDK